ncbi:MAG: hypothetical protein Q9222_004703 [Ikaeria aurantiellina]
MVKAFIRRLDIINRGFNGYNTSQALKVLPKFMPRKEQASVRFMMIFFGANDACLPDSYSGQHVPLAIYKRNLRDIIQHQTVANHDPHIILVTPPPVDEYAVEIAEAAKGIFKIRGTADHTKLYADACKEVGQHLGLTVLDLWSTFMKAAGYEPGEPLPGSKKTGKNAVLGRLLSDGLHLNPDAYRILFQSTMDLIKREWPDQAPDTSEYVYPAWRVAPGLHHHVHESTRAEAAGTE